MYCPSCGKEIPNGSTFCLHCGTKINAAGKQKAVKWEYRTFEYHYAPGHEPYRGAASIVYTRENVWQEEQEFLLPKLQLWLDLGWEPITEVGSSALIWEQYKKVELGWDLIPSRFPYEKVSAFRVKMRAPEGTEVPPEPENPMETLMKKVRGLKLDKKGSQYYQDGFSLMKKKEYAKARIEFAKVLRIEGANSNWYQAALARLNEIGLE